MVAGVAVLEVGLLVRAEVDAVARSEVVLVFAHAEVPLEPVPAVVVAAPTNTLQQSTTIQEQEERGVCKVNFFLFRWRKEMKHSY